MWGGIALGGRFGAVHCGGIKIDDPKVLRPPISSMYVHTDIVVGPMRFIGIYPKIHTRVDPEALWGIIMCIIVAEEKGRFDLY